MLTVYYLQGCKHRREIQNSRKTDIQKSVFDKDGAMKGKKRFNAHVYVRLCGARDARAHPSRLQNAENTQRRTSTAICKNKLENVFSNFVRFPESGSREIYSAGKFVRSSPFLVPHFSVAVQLVLRSLLAHFFIVFRFSFFLTRFFTLLPKFP